MNLWRLYRSSNFVPRMTCLSTFSSWAVFRKTPQSTLINYEAPIGKKIKVGLVSMKNQLSSSSNSPQHDKDYFDKLVKNNKIVVFMKGVPDEPRCGFSNAVVQILRMHGVSNYDSHNVLQDENIRQGIKDYSNWPTIPQVFINGEFVGGCDILLEMHKNGELVEQLSKIGIKSALLEDDRKA